MSEIRTSHIDSFSGQAASLPPGKRSPLHVLAVLVKHPRLSGWDLSEIGWLRNAVKHLQERELIRLDAGEPFPWCRYVVTEAGHAALAKVQS